MSIYRRPSKVDHLTLTFACAMYSIFKVHDDAKDKDFELEISWIGPESNGRHEMVPEDLRKVSPLCVPVQCLA